MVDENKAFRYFIWSSGKMLTKKLTAYLHKYQPKAKIQEIDSPSVLKSRTKSANILFVDQNKFLDHKDGLDADLLASFDTLGTFTFILADFKKKLPDLSHEEGHSIEVIAKELKYEEFDFRLHAIEARIKQSIFNGELKKHKLNDIADISSEGIVIHDGKTVIDCNARFLKLFGYRRRELSNKLLTDFLSDLGSRNRLNESIKMGSDNPFEVVGLTMSGDTFPLELRCKTIGRGEGKINAIVVRDITERKQREQEIRKLNTAIDQSQSSIVITDKQGNIEYVNKSFCEITGYSLEESIGKNPRILKSRHHSKKYYTNLWETIMGGNTWYGTFKNRTKMGSNYWEKAVISPIFDEHKNISHFLAIKENITKEKAAEQALKESEERHRIISELTNDFVFSGTIEKNVLSIDWSSGSLQKLCGYTKGELAKLKYGWYSLAVGEDLDKLIKPAITQLSSTRMLDLEYRIQTKKGRQKWVLDKTQLIEEGKGSVVVIGALQDITESKEATMELDQSKKYLDSIIDNLPIGLQIFDHKGDRVRINEKQKTIFSSNQLSLKKGTFNILKDPQSKARGAAKVYQTVYREKKAINHEVALELNQDKSRTQKDKIYLQEIIFPILRNDGSVHSVISLSADITTRIVAENALKASEKYQKVLLKIIPDLIFVFTEEGVFKNVYTEEESLLQPLDGFIGKPFSEVFPGDLSDKFYKNLKLAIKTREVQSYNYEMEINGVNFSYETRLLTSIDNEVVAIIRDITDSINAERALKDSEEKFRELAERTQDALVLISATNEILYVSPNLFEILGISQEKYIKNPLNALKLIHKDDRLWVIPELNNYRKGKQKALDLQFRVVLDKNRQKWIWYRESTVFDDQNNPLRYASVITDITENKAVEEELKFAKEEAEKANRSKSAFLANISHEIRTPMNAVLGFSDLLYSRIKDPVLKGYLDSIKSSGNTLLNLLNDILDLSKIEAQKMTIIPSPINLHDILGEIKHIFSLRALEKGLDYKFDIDENLPKTMLLDELRIKQVLLNLVDNAIKFTEKGDIRIVVRHREKGKRKNRVDLLLDVEDTGIGVPYHLQESIFDSFRQQDDQDKKKFQGTGLGLAITKRLVELCNGEITLESHPGKGSKFAVKLKDVMVTKTSEKSARFPKRKLRLENSALRGKVIVLIDREKSNRELIKEVFHHSKSKVIQGENISTLISLANKRVDLIVLEISSIESLRENLAALEGIEKFIKIPKIGICSISNIDKEFSRKFIALFTKPIDLPGLVEVVANYFQVDDFNKIDRVNSDKIIPEVDQKVVLAVIELLEQKHYPEWEAALTTSSFSEIENFANSIKRLGLEYNFKSLQTFSDVLVMHAKNFDIDKMNDVLKSFPLLISELRSTL